MYICVVCGECVSLSRSRSLSHSRMVFCQEFQCAKIVFFFICQEKVHPLHCANDKCHVYLMAQARVLFRIFSKGGFHCTTGQEALHCRLLLVGNTLSSNYYPTVDIYAQKCVHPTNCVVFACDVMSARF